MLIRGVGPTLTAFNVTTPLADPKLDLFDAASARIGGSDNWDPSLTSVFTSVGAFQLPSGSRDAAMVATLTAGKDYTVQISGVNGATGEALVEIYEVP